MHQVNHTLSIRHGPNRIIQRSVSALIESERCLSVISWRSWENFVRRSTSRRLLRPLERVVLWNSRDAEGKTYSTGEGMFWWWRAAWRREKERTTFPFSSFNQMRDPRSRYMHTKIRHIPVIFLSLQPELCIDSSSSTSVTCLPANSECFSACEHGRIETIADNTCVFGREPVLNRSDRSITDALFDLIIEYCTRLAHYHSVDDDMDAGNCLRRKRRELSLPNNIIHKLWNPIGIDLEW